MLYESSLLFTILVRKDWWNRIDEHVVLGAIPLNEHLTPIKKLGVTHVITLLEGFETQKGVLHPVSSEQWEAEGVIHKQFETADFRGVPSSILQTAVQYMTEELKKNPNEVFYLHCKAGRGRSASLAVAFKVAKKITRSTILDPHSKIQTLSNKQLLVETVSGVKKQRPQISLNSKQLKTIEEFVDKHYMQTYRELTPRLLRKASIARLTYLTEKLEEIYRKQSSRS